MPLSELGHRASGLRVLVVEDENLLAFLVEDMLAELGHEVVRPVACLSKALKMAQGHDVDIAILDLPDVPPVMTTVLPLMSALVWC